MLPSPEDAGRPAPGWDEFEHRIRSFEQAWLAGDAPRIEQFVEPQDLCGRLLVELVHADLEFRLRAGELVRVEEYVDRFPQLALNDVAVRELMTAELELRRDIEPPPKTAGVTVITEAVEDLGATLVDTSTGASAESNADKRLDGRPRRSLRQLPQRIGRFEVERFLGQGAFGTVYLASDPALDRKVAIKVPHPHVLADNSLRERFLCESRAAAALEHPNVVAVYDAGESDGVCYLVSAFCPGPNLAEWLIEQAEPLAFRTAARIVAALADGVAYSHSRGVLHRDLKPANVVLDPRVSLPTERRAPDVSPFPFTPRLTDFGLAKLLEAGLVETRTSVTLGTPLYMAPEQADGAAEPGPASDIYSLGVMLYELITGRVPFDGTLVSVLEQLRTAEPPKLSGLRQGVPRDLETICLRCLAKEPARRYGSADALREDLERFLRGEPVQARRPSLSERFSRWTTRPERMTDAGAFTLRLNTVVVVWMTFNSLTVLTGHHSSAAIQKQLAGLDERSAALDSLLIAFSTHVPLIWLGLKTIRRRQWAVRAGTAVSVALLVILAASWTEVVPMFGGLYNDPRVRTTIFSMLLLLFSTQFLLYLFAEAACRHRR